MFDLSTTFNLSVLVAVCAVAVVLLFFAIDIIAARRPSLVLRVFSIVIGALALVCSAAALFAGIGMIAGFVSLSGDSVLVFSLSVPYLARFAALTNYPVSFALFGAVFVLSLIDIIGASVKRNGKKAEVAETEPAAAEAESAETESAAEPTEDDLVAAALEKATEGRTRYEMNNVHELMNEISGLVDSLDAGEEVDTETSEDSAQASEQPQEPIVQNEETEKQEDDTSAIGDDSADDTEFVYEPVDESPEDYFADLPEDGDTEESLEEEPCEEESDSFDGADEAAETQSEQETPQSEPEHTEEPEAVKEPEHTEEPAQAKEPAKAEEPEAAEEPAKAVVPEKVGQVRRVQPLTRDIDEFTTLGKKADTTAVPPPRTIVRKPTESEEPVKEVEPQTSGLPMTKRHVIINRRNVVNMFSEYLKTKSEDEKHRIESSINTIIIK